MLGATANQLAKTTGVIKRQRNLTGAKFVRVFTLGCLQKPAATLEELTQSGMLTEVEISSQGLDKRFTEAAVTFLQQVLEEVVKTVVLAPPPVPKSEDLDSSPVAKLNAIVYHKLKMRNRTN